MEDCLSKRCRDGARNCQSIANLQRKAENQAEDILPAGLSIADNRPLRAVVEPSQPKSESVELRVVVFRN